MQEKTKISVACDLEQKGLFRGISLKMAIVNFKSDSMILKKRMKIVLHLFIPMSV